ncbi:MAG TPA: aldo/keto reductase [Sphingomicrobium sp.]|jgi:aryl-alcohol dehydrogenase-like predicted oxidoreductase|nr:aldo/keto reductase [Sphingomicrobium sp.]
MSVQEATNRNSRSAGNYMEFVDIPGTELRVSRITLGTWAIGGWMWGGTDEAESIGTIRAAFSHGINVVDTAPVYGFGRSEEIVGKALADGLRETVLIATKVGLEWHDGKITRNGSRERILREVEDSLRRLRTDRIDIYQVHWPDPSRPIAETAGAMRELYEQGTIRAIGVSNFSVKQMDEFRGSSPLHVLQPPYNLFERGIEKEILPYCRKHAIATLGYGALCRGLLSGRMRADTKFSGDDLRLHDPKFQPDRFPQYLAAVERLDQFARERYGTRVIDLAVRWVLDQGITTALWGARHPDQLLPVEAAMGWSLDAASKTDIDRILAETIENPVGPEFMAPPEYA